MGDKIPTAVNLDENLKSARKALAIHYTKDNLLKLEKALEAVVENNRAAAAGAIPHMRPTLTELYRPLEQELADLREVINNY